MKVLSSRSGFSLVELLTVIAIIAILAAIIFPVMGLVKDRANQTNCMSNLHQVAMAVQIFKQDNRKYPAVLGTEMQPDPDNASDVVPFENQRSGKTGLFPEYVKSIKLFHCPSSKIINSRDYATYNNGSSNPVKPYMYCSYDAVVRGGPGAPFKAYTETEVEPHYMWKWATNAFIEENATVPLPPYPPNPTNNPDSDTKRQADYARQLQFRNPPGDTVVTWCGYHAFRDGNVDAQGKPTYKGQAIVVFLDGHADNMPATDVETCKWRTRPKK